MMSEKLDWTTKLGDAFLAQQKQVMDAIQKLRAKAKAEGNLESTQEQTVIVKEEAQSQVIVIQSADPEVIYVPSYNPTVVYGAWPYPAYPPYLLSAKLRRHWCRDFLRCRLCLRRGLGVRVGWLQLGSGRCGYRLRPKHVC